MIQRLHKEKFSFLLVCLLFYSMAAPFFESVFSSGLFLKFSFSAVLISAVFAVSAQKKSFIIILVVTALPCLALIWFKESLFGDNFTVIELVLKIFFEGCMIFIILKYVFHTEHISWNIISAVLIGYLLLALLWANMYFLLEVLYPDSFTVSHEIIQSDISIFRYYSFVTITTLGFGDISPVSSQARSLTTLEALIGQMYMAVLVARLVGIHTAQFFQKKEK